MVKILRRARAGAYVVRDARGGRGRLATQHYIQALHAHQQTSCLVLAGMLWNI